MCDIAMGPEAGPSKIICGHGCGKSSFLSDRVQRTMVDGNLSRPIKTNTGTPQGSVLSPLLFSIYTDRITSELSNVTIIKYADDTCIIGCISNQQDLDSYFNEIDRISKQ